MSFRCLLLLTALLSALMAAAPTTQPQSDLLLETTRAFAIALSNGDAAAAEAFVGEGTRRAFGSKEPGAILDICQQFKNGTLVMARCYSAVPNDLAAALEDDASAAALPKA